MRLPAGDATASGSALSDVQHRKLRAHLPHPGQRPLDLLGVATLVGEETGLLPEPEVTHPSIGQPGDLVEHVANVAEIH